MKFILFRKRSLLFAAILFIMLAVAVVGTSMTGSAAIWSGKTIRRQPIRSVETVSNNVALSFDVSWGAEQTPIILKILQDCDVVATYFAAGFWAEANSEKLRGLSDSGRLEIGTHSNTHRDMAKLSASQIKLELETSINIIEGITGKKVQLFRAPYGSYSNTLLEVAAKMKLYTIQHSVNSLDYKGLSSSDIANRVVSGAKSGSIILMHNDGEHTVEALPVIIEGIKNKGLNFVTVGELIYKENFTVDYTGKQIRSN